MKKLLLTTALLAACFAADARNSSKDIRMTSAGMVYLNSSYETYDALSREIHGYAEVGYHEYKSSAALISHLEANGFVVEKGVAGIPTAFVAKFGSGHPVIGMMAEYDALPGMAQDAVPYRSTSDPGAPGHGCGHNLLGTGSVAGAVAVSRFLAQGHKGTICLFGCPAEEGGGGKAYMMRAGCFEGLDAMLDWHPDAQITVNEQPGLANVQVRFSFWGRSAHASGAPENGRSALDAIEAFDFMMNLMREHVPSDSRIHYVITNGGKSPNVVPDYAEVVYYFRNPDREVVRDIFERSLKAAEGAAMGTGTTFGYEVISGNYERLPNHVLSELIFKNLKTVGGILYSEDEMSFAMEMMKNSCVSDTDAALKKISSVVPASENKLSQWVSSDVGNVTWAVPTGSFRMAAFVPAGGGHCWQQVACSGMSIGTKGLMAAARVLYLTAYDLLTTPSLVQSAKSEFEQKRGDGFTFKPLMGDRKPAFDYQISK